MSLVLHAAQCGRRASIRASKSNNSPTNSELHCSHYATLSLNNNNTTTHITSLPHFYIYLTQQKNRHNSLTAIVSTWIAFQHSSAHWGPFDFRPNLPWREPVGRSPSRNKSPGYLHHLRNHYLPRLVPLAPNAQPLATTPPPPPLDPRPQHEADRRSAVVASAEPRK